MRNIYTYYRSEPDNIDPDEAAGDSYRISLHNVDPDRVQTPGGVCPLI